MATYRIRLRILDMEDPSANDLKSFALFSSSDTHNVVNEGMDHDADVIMTAAILGFSAGRLAVGHPVEFAAEEKDLKETQDAVEKINKALGKKYSYGGQTKAVATPPWEKGAVITGAAGASKSRFDARHAPITDETSKELHDILSQSPDFSYQGRGAYTGFMNDPVTHHPMACSTVRFNIPNDGEHGSRWRPLMYNYTRKPGANAEEQKKEYRLYYIAGEESKKAWGLIAGKDEIIINVMNEKGGDIKYATDERGEFVTKDGQTVDPNDVNLVTGKDGRPVVADDGKLVVSKEGQPGKPFPLRQQMFQEQAIAGDIVGYTHGMMQVIYKAANRGPWCTPFEIAVGGFTTKVASCFPCSLYMYAAGYPPSAIHLGRGESWAPFYPDMDIVRDAEFFKAAISSINNRWYLECWQHLSLGMEIMEAAAKENKVEKLHIVSLKRLKKWLQNEDLVNNDICCAANLILDAVTVHSSETARVARTIV